MSRKKAFIIVSLILVKVTFFLWLYAKKKNNNPSPQTYKTTNVDIRAHNISLSELAPKGLKGWKIRSPHVEFSRDNSHIKGDNVSLSVITKKDETAILNADHGCIETKTKNVQLNGNIKSTFNDFEIYGNVAHYIFENHTLESSEHVSIIHPRMKVTADSLFAELSTNKISFVGNVHSEFSLSPASNNS